jgi:predicted anti-sigma-YlaC factor YlaD
MSMPGLTITCREIVEVMTDYLENKLERAERLCFERHLVQCPPCRDYLGQLRTTIEEMGRLRAHESEVPAGTRSAMLEAFRTFRRASRGNADD